VPRDFGCASWASGAGPPRASDGFSHVETRRLPEARWQRRVVVRPQDYSGFGLKPQTPNPKWAQLARARARGCIMHALLHARIAARSFNRGARLFRIAGRHRPESAAL
jgi:hypothetical protein